MAGIDIDASRTDKPSRPIGRGKSLDAYDACRTRCMDELIRADRDADMRGAAAHGLEKYQIARLHLSEADFLTGAVLLADFARQQHAVFREDPLDQAAAIKSGRIAPAVAVWDAAQFHGGLDDRREPRG